MKKYFLIGFLLLVASCSGVTGTGNPTPIVNRPAASSPSDETGDVQSTAPNAGRATATLQPASGSTVEGQLEFIEQGGVVTIRGTIRNLTPGPHAFHIHETGDCSAPDASSAGPHFNPTAMPHGDPAHEAHHAGDFGNITADERGEALVNATTTSITLLAGPASVIGRAVIVHENVDDLVSQPAGNAGARIACGVIKW
ncbi:MAG: superoxide dismutase family protein [Deltaproteobacteria bacterium]|nr:superoxide dismutase family protein [Deltaproteobacteria bacterium]